MGPIEANIILSDLGMINAHASEPGYVTDHLTFVCRSSQVICPTSANQGIFLNDNHQWQISSGSLVCTECPNCPSQPSLRRFHR
jgi:hypothetical protein